MTGQSRRLLAAAIHAAGRGWPVFPLQPYGKRPAIRDWPHRATRNRHQLTDWWTLAPYNIGIACGPAGLLVLDLDRRPVARPATGAAALDGVEAFAALVLRRNGANPRTYTVATPGGEHRYFTVPVVHAGVMSTEDGLSGRTTVGVLGPGVDTRAVGGYVVGAGSVRRTSDRRRYYRVTHPDSAAPAPAWLLDALTPPQPPSRGSGLVELPSAYARAALEREAAAVSAAQPGTRNSCLFGAAVRLGQLAAAGLLTEADATSALLLAAGQHIGTDGFTSAEAVRTIGNGLSYGRRRPRKVGRVDR